MYGRYFAFGPVAYVKNAKSHLLSLLDHNAVIDWFHLRGLHEFMPGFGWFTTDVGTDLLMQASSSARPSPKYAVTS
jgi:hypothetical protein